MDPNASAGETDGHRRHHRRNASSRTNILRALVPSNRAQRAPSSQDARDDSNPTADAPTHKGNPLGERQSNVQAPPTASPSKSRPKSVEASKTDTDPPRTAESSKPLRSTAHGPKKTKSSSNLGSVFARMNRSSKDVSQLVEKDKENTTPPTSRTGPIETPIWAQFSNAAQSGPRMTADADSVVGDGEKQARPDSRRAGGDRDFTAARDDSAGELSQRSEGGQERSDRWLNKGTPAKGGRSIRGKSTSRKTSGSSAEQQPRERLDVVKRGSRVMAAVAALQGKNKEEVVKEEPPLDPRAVDKAFEAVLDSRNIPEPMREKMRSLTLRVKVDFIKQDQAGVTGADSKVDQTTAKLQGEALLSSENRRSSEDGTKSGKRSRPQSRSFTFSKSDKRSGETSPSKKHRSSSKGRPGSVQIPDETGTCFQTTPTTPTGSLGKKSAAAVIPADFIAYLHKHRDPCVIEVGRVHKLRILLRRETVAWVDNFISAGGMAEIVDLLHRIMKVEWREEHEDQLLHETLLCLKGLCTTERAIEEVDKVADELFPALLAMLYDEEKKGPAEYSTRTIIINVLFNYLQSATTSSSEVLERRAQKILSYLGEPQKPDDARPVDFVLGMHRPRPYKLWCQEVTYVTKEVFWIFLHHLNVVPLPKAIGSEEAPVQERNPTQQASEPPRTTRTTSTYTHRHFPGIRAPVPAAPYIGGVEWDATTYIASHLDLLNGLLACLPSPEARNLLRAELQASGFEKTLGCTLRTCKEKFYSGVHDGLRGWVAAAAEDGWDTKLVREGPDMEEQAARGRSASPKKAKEEKPPRLEEVKVETPGLGLGMELAQSLDRGGEGKKEVSKGGREEEDGWLE